MRSAGRSRSSFDLKRVVRTAAAMGLSAAAAWGGPRAATAVPPPAAESSRVPVLAPGTEAPLFSAERLDGDALSLAALRGHVVLLNFWAVACPPCRIEMPELESIHRRYVGRGLRVIGVTEMDPSRDQALRSVAETGVTYPILLDPGARIGQLYALEAHPTTVILDARGRVRYVNVGYLRGKEKEIERAVQEALAAGKGNP
jgi:peroxiredoxin